VGHEAISSFSPLPCAAGPFIFLPLCKPAQGRCARSGMGPTARKLTSPCAASCTGGGGSPSNGGLASIVAYLSRLTRSTKQRLLEPRVMDVGVELVWPGCMHQPSATAGNLAASCGMDHLVQVGSVAGLACTASAFKPCGLGHQPLQAMLCMTLAWHALPPLSNHVG